MAGAVQVTAIIILQWKTIALGSTREGREAAGNGIEILRSRFR